MTRYVESQTRRLVKTETNTSKTKSTTGTISSKISPREDGRAFVHVALGSRCVKVCREKLHFRPRLCFVPPTFKRNRKLWHTDVSRPFGFTFAVVVYLQILKTTKCQSSSVYCRTTSAAGCFANSCSSPKDLSYIFKIHFKSLLVYQQYRVDCR